MIADGFRGNDLVVRHDGGIYVTNPGWDGKRAEQGLVHQPEGREEGRRHRAEVRQRRHALARPDAALRRRQPHATGSTATRSSPTARWRTSRSTTTCTSPTPPTTAAPTACASTATAGSTSPRGWASRSATRRPRELHHPDARTARSRTSASAARTSTRSTPPAATRSTSAR